MVNMDVLGDFFIVLGTIAYALVIIALVYTFIDIIRERRKKK